MIELIVVAQCIQAVEESKRFKELCDSLPDERAELLRKDRKVRIKDEREHRKKLEIADAGRARNFWGN